MRIIITTLVILITIIFCSTMLYPAIITLNDGSVIEGRIISTNDSTIVIENSAIGQISIPANQIADISFESSSEVPDSHFEQQETANIPQSDDPNIENLRRERFDEGLFWTFNPDFNLAWSCGLWGYVLGSELEWISQEWDFYIPLITMGAGFLAGTITALTFDFNIDDTYLFNLMGMMGTVNFLSLGCLIDYDDGISFEGFEAIMTLTGNIIGLSMGGLLMSKTDLYAGSANIIQSTTTYSWYIGYAISTIFMDAASTFENNTGYLVFFLIPMITMDVGFVVSWYMVKDLKISLERSQYMNIGGFAGGLMGLGVGLAATVNSSDNAFISAMVGSSCLGLIIGYAVTAFFSKNIDTEIERTLFAEGGLLNGNLTASFPGINLLPDKRNDLDVVFMLPTITYRF